MRKSRFTEEQIVSFLGETDRDAVPVAAKRHGVSEQTIYTWKKRLGSFQPDDVRRLKQLGQENARLKKLVAERDLEIEVMKEIAKKMVSVSARQEQVAYAVRRGLSQRRSSTLLGVARSALGHRSAKAVKDAPVLADGGAGRAIPALRLPSHPHFPGARGPRHELGPLLSTVAAGQAAGAASAAARAHCQRPATAPGADRRQPGVVV